MKAFPAFLQTVSTLAEKAKVISEADVYHRFLYFMKLAVQFFHVESLVLFLYLTVRFISLLVT